MRALSPSPPRVVGVWLHRLHFPEGASTPQPLRGDAAELTESEHKRRASLRALLQKAVLGQDVSAEAGSRSLARYPEGEALTLNETHINYTVEGGSIPLIPLLLADVVDEPVRKRPAFGRTEHATHIVLVAPRAHAELSEDPESSSQIWLLCVGRCADQELIHFLFSLGRRGALRWDVKQSYSISRKVCGIGGQGAVFTGAARSPTKDVHLIIKEDKPMLNVENLHNFDMVAVKVWNSNNTTALRSEVGLLQKMCGHPNISAFLGVFCELGDESMAQKTQWVTVVELCPGGDLFELVSDIAIQQENAMQIMIGIFSALVYLHASKIAHRDVKAENVVLRGERAVLIDFGIACRIDDVEAMTKRVGSPGYVAPEIIMSKRYNEKVDVFSAGVILYFMLRSKLPFSADSQDAILEKTVRCEVSYSSDRFLHVSSGLMDIMKLTINKDVNSRPGALECFYKVYAMARKEVRTSEAFRFAKLGLALLGDIQADRESHRSRRATQPTHSAPLDPSFMTKTSSAPSPPSASSDSQHLLAPPGRDQRPSSASTPRSDPPETETLSLNAFEPSSTDLADALPPERQRSSSSAGSVWQLIQGIQEIPTAAMRRFRKISGSSSFSAVRQICNVAGDLPRVIGMTPDNSVSAGEFTSIAEDEGQQPIRSDTLQLSAADPGPASSAPQSPAAAPAPPPSVGQPVPKHRQKLSFKLTMPRLVSPGDARLEQNPHFASDSLGLFQTPMRLGKKFTRVHGLSAFFSQPGC